MAQLIFTPLYRLNQIVRNCRLLQTIRIYLKGDVELISKEKLIKILIKGRYECYVLKDSSYNPYTKSVLYDWDFKLEIDDMIFTDSYRGFNPYSGVEYVYNKDNNIPVWSCDYVGYVNQDANVSSEEIYKFLKEARGNHLKNCKDNLFSNYTYGNDLFNYKTLFQGDVNSLLQIENFYYKNLLVAQQMTAGRLKQSAAIFIKDEL
jgi:hypothetical protein